MHHDHDPDGDGMLFGLPHGPDEALVHVIPVPWEAVRTYGPGTRRGPEAVLQASAQVELLDANFGEVWRFGIHQCSADPHLATWSDESEADAVAVVESKGGDTDAVTRLDARCAEVEDSTWLQSRDVLAEGRLPIVLGGDHSVAHGNLRAVSEAFGGLGVLHIGARARLRPTYLGLHWSHASVFYRALHLPGIARVVGVGWREVSAPERSVVYAEPERIEVFEDHDIALELAHGGTWGQICQRIIAALPAQVHVSFDVGGLDPTLCPRGGAAVPGGLSFHQVQVLLAALAAQREVVGVDLVEVSCGPDWRAGRPDLFCDWDALVGARLLYKLAGCALRGRERIHAEEVP